MISGTNQVKNTIAPQGSAKAGVYLWGDSIITWGDTVGTWGGVALSGTNQTKNVVTPTNQVKS